MHNLQSKLSQLWYKERCVKKIRIPESLDWQNLSLEWALNIAKNDPQLMATALKSVFKSEESHNKSMIYASRGNASSEVRKKLIEGLENKLPIQLQVNALYKKYRQIHTLIEQEVNPVAKLHHPLGFFVDSSMWITGPGHTYDAHCDVADHFLMQICGKKRIRLWGPAENYNNEPLYNFDFREDPKRFLGNVHEIEIGPGEAIFFSPGTMHEVSVEGNDISLSLSLALKHLYPLLNIIEDLNEANPNNPLELKENFSHWDKFRTLFFDPSHHYDPKNTSTMPHKLKNSILQKLAKKSLNTAHQLDQWWSNLCAEKNYTKNNVYPNSPKNKTEVLAKLEKERSKN